MKRYAFTVGLLLLAITACGKDENPAASSPTATREVPTPTATATAVQASATSTPPATPTPMVVPATTETCDTVADPLRHSSEWPDASWLEEAVIAAVLEENPELGSENPAVPDVEISTDMDLPEDIPLDGPKTFTMELALPHRLEETTSFGLASSPGYDFIVISATGEIVWRYSDDVETIQEPGSIELSPGQRQEMSATWDLMGPDGTKIDHGLYWVFGIIFREDATFQFEEAFAFFGERPPLEEALEVVLTAPSEAACGYSIPLTLEVTNVTDNVVTIYTGVDFDNYFAFAYEDDSREEVWNWWANKAMIQPLYTPWIPPGDTATFSASWELQTSDGEPVAPGSYELQARIRAAQVDDLRNREEFAWSNIVEVTVSR